MSYQFLTTKPRRRLLSTLHKEWVHILFKSSAPSANLYCRLDYTDGSSDTVEIDTVSAVALGAGEVKVLDVSFSRLAADAAVGKTVKQLVISLANVDMESQPDYLIYEPWTPQGDTLRVFYYHNGHGGLDSLITEGNVTSQQRGEIAELRTRGETKFELSVLSQPEEEEWSVQTGPRHPIGELLALRDMFMIRSIFERVPVSGGHKFLSVLLLNESIEYGSVVEAMNPMTLRFKYAVDNQSYKRIALSNGRVAV